MSTPSDAFETLRNCRNLYLKHLGALLQDKGSLGAGAIQVIQEGAGAYFDEMVASSRRGSFQDEAGGLTASRITLVGEEDLELGIRLDNLTARLFGSAGETLWKLHLRFVTLLNRPDLSKSDNPLGPRGVVQGLERMLERAGAVSLDKKLDLLDALADYLNDSLPALYAELESFLSGAGVTAAQAGIITSPDAPKKSQNSASTAEARPVAPQQAPRQVSPPPAASQRPATADVVPLEVMDEIRSLRRIVEQHQGQIHVRDRAGGGSEFVVQLPVVVSTVPLSGPRLLPAPLMQEVPARQPDRTG